MKIIFLHNGEIKRYKIKYIEQNRDKFKQFANKRVDIIDIDGTAHEQGIKLGDVVNL